MMLIRGDNDKIPHTNISDLRLSGLLRGWRRIMIHKGDIDMAQPGYFLYRSPHNPYLQTMIWIDHVQKMKLSEVPERFPDEMNVSESLMLHKLRKCYPDISLEDEVTVISHETPQETVKNHGLPKGFDI